jgi:hypothetical protein
VFIEQLPCGVVDITSNPLAGYTPPLDFLILLNGKDYLVKVFW